MKSIKRYNFGAVQHGSGWANQLYEYGCGVNIMRVNALTRLIKFPISHQAARPLSPLFTSLWVCLSHTHTCIHISTHLCQSRLGGVVKLSIARKRSFIKADRRGGRLLKLITPRSHRKPWAGVGP